MSKGAALIIGLNSIDPGHYGTDGQLGGCENDAATMEQIATKLGYRVEKLLTRQATLANVRAAIERVAGELQPGDSFLLSYAGHGSQVPDDQNHPDEADGFDETWCLFDGMLVDDELRRFWTQFAENVTIYMVSDSCHSGSMLRAVDRDLAVADQASRDLGRRYVPRILPKDKMEFTYVNNKAAYDELERELNSQPVSDDMIKATVMLLSGCQDNQTSKDNGTHGVFTEAMLGCFQEGKLEQSDYSFADLHADVVARIDPRLDQTPQFTSLTGEQILLSGMALNKPFQIG